MNKLNRPIKTEDLKQKGYPFECANCGSKPIPIDVINNHGVCVICGDDIITYTIDTAELIIKLEILPKEEAGK